jgi:tetratricopeptide (TPR) repeat protein
MAESTRQIGHLPFISALATSRDTDASASAVRAGLLVLRLVDAWTEDGALAVAPDARATTAARTAIESISQGTPARALLGELLDAMLESPSRDTREVFPRLLTYGYDLELDAQWALAVDVYDTILAHVLPDEDSDSAIGTQLRRASCFRDLGRFNESDVAYNVVTSQARNCGNTRGELRAEIGRAKLAMARGNLPLADEILVETVRRADVDSLPDERSRALHERSYLAFARGEYDAALYHGFAALREVGTQPERDRLLGDIAAAFIMLGVRPAARNVFLNLAATARELSVRWAATINLMEFASEEGDRPQFETYRDQLEEAGLPPRLRVEFELHVGRGYQILGEPDSAQEWLERALVSGNSYSFNELIFRVERLLRAVPITETGQLPMPAPNIPIAVEQIAAKLRAMRELSVWGSE